MKVVDWREIVTWQEEGGGKGGGEIKRVCNVGGGV